MAAIIYRNRIIYSFLFILTIIFGLTIRKAASYFPSFIAMYAPDALWALMVFWMVGILFSSRSSWFIGAITLLFSYGIECSQLYHAPWIDTIRETTLGGLILGFGFLWTDILAYTIGVLIGIMIEKWIIIRYW